MNKEEFLNTLRKRLSVLEDSEIDDIISEYEGYIEEKVNAGSSERDAVKELGDIDEIVKDLLAAYKVKEPKNDGLNNAVNKISNAIDNFMRSLDDKSGKDIIRILIEIIIILLAIWLLKIPFALIRDLGEEIFYEVHNPISNILGSIWWIIIEFSYIIVAVIFFFKMFEKRYFKNVSTRIIDEVEEDYKKEKNKKDIKREEKENVKKTKEEINESNRYETKKVNRVVVKEHTFVDTLTDICIALLKFLAVFFLVGVIFYQVGISIALGVMIYLICKGVTYFGVLILLIAFFMGGAFILELLINFLFNKKMKAYRVFSSLISCIVVLAVGLTMTAIEISNTEIIYDSAYQTTKNTTKEIPITNNSMEFYYYDNIIVDNNLKDTIRIEYKYPDINDLKIEINLEKCGTGYCLYSDINYFKWSKKSLDYLVEHLKDKKIYTYDFRIVKNIYVNENDLDKIKGNKHYYYDYNDKKTYTFTRTWEVLNIAESNEEEYIYLTLRQFQGEEIETVKVLKNINYNIEAGKSYEFTFTFKGEEPEEDIKDIFEECNLIKIELTDRIGLDQLQEPFKS